MSSEAASPCTCLAQVSRGLVGGPSECALGLTDAQQVISNLISGDDSQGRDQPVMHVVQLTVSFVLP
jgi:hypothetical protein